jgi:hypothetical protein
MLSSKASLSLTGAEHLLNYVWVVNAAHIHRTSVTVSVSGGSSILLALLWMSRFGEQCRIIGCSELRFLIVMLPSSRSFIFLRKVKSYPSNRPWRPIGLWDVQDPTLSRKSAHRWRWVCQLYLPTGFYSPEILFFYFCYSFLLDT